MSSNNNIFTFKGQVKVANIQNAFNELIARINNIVDVYNETDTFLEEQDYSKGGDSLGAAGYTLTVGGIKQVLQAYAGTLIGCRAFRIDPTHVIVTDGVYFKTNKVIRINSQILTGEGTAIYIDNSTDEIGLTTEGDEVSSGQTVITYLSTTGTDTYLNCHRGVQLEGLKDYSITIKDREIGGGIEGDDPSRHRFQGGGVTWANASGGGELNFMGEDVLSYAWSGGEHRRHAWVNSAKFFFIPKGCPTPLWVGNDWRLDRPQYTMVLNKGSS